VVWRHKNERKSVNAPTTQQDLKLIRCGYHPALYSAPTQLHTFSQLHSPQWESRSGSETTWGLPCWSGNCTPGSWWII